MKFLKKKSALKFIVCGAITNNFFKSIITPNEEKFDCVKMKWEIQQQIEKEFAGLSDKEAHQAQMKKILENDILGRFLEKMYSANQIVGV